MRKNKISLSAAGRARHTWLLNLAAIAVLIFFVAVTCLYIDRVLKNSDFFKIRAVFVKGSDVDLSYLKGHNIFALDIEKEAQQIKEIYPDFKLVRIIRVFPDRLFVDFIKRKPIALLRFYRYFCVDSDSVLFDCSMQPGYNGLPLIVGLETKIFGPKPGKKYNVKELTTALGIILEKNKQPALRGYEIKKIDAANQAGVSFFLVCGQGAVNQRVPAVTQIQGFEVKTGQDNIKDKIIILASLLAQQKDKLKNIKYIDLRFGEPVIKFNDVK